ncbi:MAG: hypothetical protein COB84_01840 [Rhodobacteraceae bacterium]|nr:MAG: hypothetical protein COB84_01840 [Paracoccaceae bacterium]
MGNLTTNISRHELECNCGECDVNIQDHEPIIQVVQNVCDVFAEIFGVKKVVLIITSPARCYEYNRIPVAEGGPGSDDQSQHPRCNAIDFIILVNGKQVNPERIHAYLCTRHPHKYGFGLYKGKGKSKGFNHADTRAAEARWVAS